MSAPPRFYQIACPRCGAPFSISPHECRSLAVLTLQGVPPWEIPAVLDDATVGVAQPIPPLFELMDEADFWARNATRAEVLAYGDRCLAVASPRDQKILFDRHYERNRQ